MHSPLGERRIRELAVKADCDPRTFVRVLATRIARSPSARRALKIALAEGIITEAVGDPRAAVNARRVA